MDVINYIFGAVTIISVFITIYYGRKSIRLEKEKNKIDWADLQLAVKSLSRELVLRKFIPDIIITPGLRGATLANLLEQEFTYKKNIPVFVGITLSKNTNNINEYSKEYVKLETSKWVVLIPCCIFSMSGKKILILDDYVMTGDFLQNMIDSIVKSGINKQNIKSMALATTKTAIDSNKNPDFYWHITKDSKFLFPWGESK